MRLQAVLAQQSRTPTFSAIREAKVEITFGRGALGAVGLHFGVRILGNGNPNAVGARVGEDVGRNGNLALEALLGAVVLFAYGESFAEGSGLVPVLRLPESSSSGCRAVFLCAYLAEQDSDLVS